MTSSPVPHRLSLLAALPVLLFASGAFAQDCSDGSSCGSASQLTQDLLQSRVDRTLATTPGQDQIMNRLNQQSWSANGSTVPTPFNVNATGTDLQTSLSDWRSSISAAERKRIEDLQKKNAKLKLPKPRQHAPSPVNVWVDTNHQSLDTDAVEASTRGSAMTTYVGADYRWHSDLLMGGLVQVDNTEQNLINAGEGMAGKAYMAGPYAAYRLTSNVIVDAKAAWGQSSDFARSDDVTDDFTTDRSLSQARISGTWGLKKWQLAPSGAITRVSEETAAPIGNVGDTNIDETRISVRPELRRPITIEKGKQLQPFAYVQSSVSLDNSTLAEAAPQNSVGGGLTLSQTNAYNISASADYTRTMDDLTPPAVTGNVSVNVPLGLK